jgi:multidrug efflux pump subunit AcrA (membrane-fusion protein)
LLKRLRLQGLDEEDVRQFVAKFAGRNWEELFESLFGYEAKITARAILLRGGSAGIRDKHAAWREPLIGAMDRIEKARRETRERSLLQSIERAQLLAAGASAEAAENQARQAAEAMVQAAGRIREAELQRVRIGNSQHSGSNPVNVHAAVLTPEQNPFAFAPEPRDPLGTFAGLIVGVHVRAVVASLLLAGCALWAHQNAIFSGAEIEVQATKAFESQDFSTLQETAARDLKKATRPLILPGIPSSATAWLDGWNAGFAGLLLLASLFSRGSCMAVLTLLGAAVAALGHRYGIRTVEPFRAEHVALMLGTVLALIGLRMGKR